MNAEKPIDMLLFCPICAQQHIDQPQPEKDWTNPPHRSHECQACGHVWRPADIATNGVAAIQTKGQSDGGARPQGHSGPCVDRPFGTSIILKDGFKVSIVRGKGAEAAHVWLAVYPPVMVRDA